MSLTKYGVLKGIAKKTKTEIEKNPHYQVLIEDRKGTKYRVAINIHSQDYPSEVLYYVGEDFHSEEITKLAALEFGFTEIVNNQPVSGLDYIRGNLLDSKKMNPLPAYLDGLENDLSEKIHYYFQQAINNYATIYAFGQKWGPEKKYPDQHFKFSPGNGMHDIHMNQGNVGKWQKDNGIWQDGGILMHFAKKHRWVAIFLAFQSQSWCTDDYGNAILPVEKCNHLIK